MPERPPIFAITRALWTALGEPVPRGDTRGIYLLTLFVMACFTPLLVVLDALFTAAVAFSLLAGWIKKAARGKPHVAMGLHAPMWCATCSRGSDWVPWPCGAALSAQRKAERDG